ncbi:MAG: hypothetical protein J6T26_04805 [Firmicutes bacterium]|nr:hypothetical protein [Bacillota bacterium]
MPKLRALTEEPPLARGDAEDQVAELRDYLLKIVEELGYLLTHLEADNINDSTFQRISAMIPKAFNGLPLMDGEASPGQSPQWVRGDHVHPTDVSRAAESDLAAHVGNTANPHGVTAAQVGLGNVANERQYSANNPPPYPVTSVNGETGAVVLDYPAIYRDTTAAWNAQITLVAEAGAIYVYTDYASATVDGQTVPVPGIKIGDGTSYLIDMAFAAQDIAQALAAHAADTTIHVTAAEKQAWNNKVSVSVDGEDLAFSTAQ